MTASFGDQLATERADENGHNGAVSHLAGLSPAPGDYPVETLLWLVLGQEGAESARTIGLPGVTSIPSTAWAENVERWGSHFRDRSVVVAFDCDDRARAAARTVAGDLANVAAEVCILDLDPERQDGFNLTAWIAAQDDDDPRGLLEEQLRQTGEVIPLTPEIPAEPEPPKLDGEAIDGAEVLDAIAGTLDRYVIFQGDAQRDAVALWVAHTYAIEAAHATPYLTVLSPEKGSGKSRLLEVIEALARLPYHVSNISEAALFRLIERDQPSLLLDEVDRLYSNAKSERAEMLTGILNAGNRRNSKVIRCGGPSRDELHEFDPFCPKVLAGIDNQRMPDTITDRAIEIRLQRKAPHERVERFRHRVASHQAEPIRDRVEAWAEANLTELRHSEPETPNEVSDRMAEAWEPLFAIAAVAGGDWMTRCRRACLELSGGPGLEEDVPLGSRLLMEIQDVFEHQGVEWMWSQPLCVALCAIDEAPWSSYGKTDGGLKVRHLAHLLKPYGIRPANIRDPDSENTVHKGYRLAQFAEAFSRYGRRADLTENRYVADHVAADVADDSAPQEGCSGVADNSGGTGTAADDPDWQKVCGG